MCDSGLILVLGAETALCPAWIGQASGSFCYPEAEWTLLPTTRALLSSNKTPVLPKEAVFLLTRYNLGSTAMRGALLGNVLQRPSYIASLSDSPAEALWKE
nr:LOW QUALITY PROTEIN: BH3-like motif-containing cell death inducer [Manis javanica]